MPNTKLKPQRKRPGRRLAAAMGMLLLGASCVPAGTATRPLSAAALTLGNSESGVAAQPLPTLEPSMLRPVAASTAEAMNAAIPIANVDNPAARAFTVGTRSMVDRMRSVDCLTSAIYYEAASESEDGQRAVAQVVLNRVRHPAYPNSVCGVVYQGSERTTGCQFTFTCDGSLARPPSALAWARARRVAEAALAGSVFAPVGHATHYHTHQVLPYWASSLVKSAVIGAHIFYRWNGRPGTPGAFRQAYAGVEPLPRPKLRQQPLLAIVSAPMLNLDLPAARQAEAGSPRLAIGPIQDPPGTNFPKVSYNGPGLPESQIREEYRFSGVPRDELPAAMR